MAERIRPAESLSVGVLGDLQLARRMMAVAGLFGIALIHVLDLNSKLEETKYLGVLFIGLICASLLVAEMLMRRDDLRASSAAGLLAAATILGYCISRTVGLPGEPDDDVGNWLEPLGLASLLVEALVVWLSVSRLLSHWSTRPAD
jgi:hypothetical protein